MATTQSTPPNHPIYQVFLTPAQIVGLVERVFPASGVVDIDILKSGQSFNNRIYFLTLNHHLDKGLPEQVVLKVIGRFFDGRKIQNEVANLSLLQKHCPDVPTPDVVAWSEDGKVIHSATTVPDNHEITISRQDHQHKWLMMTRMPGRKMTTEDLIGEHAVSIARQLVDHTQSWNHKVPGQWLIGNFKINHDGVITCDNYKDMSWRVEGLLFADLQPTKQLVEPLDYYCHLLENKVHNLRTKDVFTHLRKILPQIEDFQKNELLELPFLHVAREWKDMAVFTHQDLAPRNFLLTDTPSGPVISGVVDFEWAGLFPQCEDYLNTYVKMKGDWPSEFWDDFMKQLADRGLPAPSFGEMTTFCWEQGCDLIRLIEDIAPWWLEAGHVEGEELEKQLDEVAARIEGLLKKLKT